MFRVLLFTVFLRNNVAPQSQCQLKLKPQVTKSQLLIAMLSYKYHHFGSNWSKKITSKRILDAKTQRINIWRGSTFIESPFIAILSYNFWPNWSGKTLETVRKCLKMVKMLGSVRKCYQMLANIRKC